MASDETADPLGSHRRERANERELSKHLPVDEPGQVVRGERLTALVHMYRAEVNRSVSWRRRLDVTTNWAVVTTGAGMTFALGDNEPQRHVVIPLISVLITFFLFLEARRYRNYDLWQHRVHLLESELYAVLLDAERCSPAPGWQTRLALDLRQPEFHISFFEAVGWRLRRNYIWLYITHLLIWFVKVAIHPVPITELSQFFARATVGPVPGWIMIAVGVIFNGALVAAALTSTRRLRFDNLALRC